MRAMLLSAVAALLTLPEPAAAEWHEAKTKHFIIYADQDPAMLRAYAERLERFDRSVREFRQMADPELSDSGRLTIFVLSSEDAVSRLIGQMNAAGMYTARAGGAFAFVPRRAGSKYDKTDLDAEQIFFHEYAHHLQLQSAASVPSWVAEGFAEFFASAVMEPDGGVIIGRYPPYRVNALGYIGITSEQIVTDSHRSQNALESHVFYGQAWLLTHFFAFNKGRKGQLVRYLADIQSGKPMSEAAASAFGDLKQLNREVQQYKRGKLISLRLRPALPSTPIQVRPLAPGEAALMPARIQSTRGVNAQNKGSVLSRARKAANGHDRDAAAQVALAEAEIDADNYREAESAADRALAVDPTNRMALIFKGRAQMEQAKANPAKADWRTIRSWFTKANRSDPDAAEPLLRFDETYSAAGIAPTENAIKGLLYVAQLVPQDEGSRMKATVQLLRSGRTADARAMFSPLAFAPHASDATRAIAAKIMTAISSGDAPAALRVIDEIDAEAKRRSNRR